KNAAGAAKEAADADAVVGFSGTDIIRAGKKLRWSQIAHAGVEKELSPELIKSDIVVTTLQRLHGPNVADQAMALLLCLSRGIVAGLHPEQSAGASASDLHRKWNQLKAEVKPVELHGKTMLVVGLGGI